MEERARVWRESRAKMNKGKKILNGGLGSFNQAAPRRAASPMA